MNKYNYQAFILVLILIPVSASFIRTRIMLPTPYFLSALIRCSKVGCE
jgi:hypothetical protein